MRCLVDEMKRIASRVQRKVREAVLAGRCLQCDGRAVKRGVCNKCYMRVWYLMRPMTPNQRREYEDELSRTGSMLREQEVREIRRMDVLSILAKKVIAHG